MVKDAWLSSRVVPVRRRLLKVKSNEFITISFSNIPFLSLSLHLSHSPIFSVSPLPSASISFSNILCLFPCIYLILQYPVTHSMHLSFSNILSVSLYLSRSPISSLSISSSSIFCLSLHISHSPTIYQFHCLFKHSSHPHYSAETSSPHTPTSFLCVFQPLWNPSLSYDIIMERPAPVIICNLLI